MAACRRFLNAAKTNKNIIYTSCRCYTTNVELKPKSDKGGDIVIPYRIHRGPTDILKALASTISKDYTAPQYKYEDDPYFIPASNVSKRAFALSKESGKKAARYFLEKYPELFLCNQSVPHIKAFNPPTVYTQENVTSPDVLVKCIQNFEVTNSINVYKILKEKGITVSQEIKQELLELLSFYNGIEPPDEDYYEERYFRRFDNSEEKWNAKGEAERLFDEMEKNSKSYSAMIAGAGKFQDAERAFQLYDEMKSQGLTPTIEAYNSLISAIPLMREERKNSCEHAMHLLSAMKNEGLMPDLYTMNAVLDVFIKRRHRTVEDLALGIVGEMRKLNIEPSLGTYSTLLDIFIDDFNPKLGVLHEIIDKLDGQELSVRHPSDVSFFLNAMEKCYRYARDINLAYRINKIVEYRNNCKLLGNSFSESLYFRNFFRLLSEMEEFEKLMEVYTQYVPNIYTPEPLLMLDILQNLQLTGHYKYLPKLCTDVFVFEQTEREKILTVILETAASAKHEKEIQTELVNIIWKMVEKINRRLESGRFNFVWSGTDLGYALITFVNGKDLEKSWTILKQLAEKDTSIIGPPSKESLLKFCELFLENKDYEKVEFCLEYATREAFPEMGQDFKKLIDKMYENEQLEPKQRVHVNNLLQKFLTEDDIEKQPSNKLSKASSSIDASSSDTSSSDTSSGDSSSSDSSSSDEDEK